MRAMRVCVLKGLVFRANDQQDCVKSLWVRLEEVVSKFSASIVQSIYQDILLAGTIKLWRYY